MILSRYTKEIVRNTNPGVLKTHSFPIIRITMKMTTGVATNISFNITPFKNGNERSCISI
jgi:hypothetical protein